MVRRWQFHITAGILCLDFANTLSWRRSARPVERLETFEDLASWARQVGLVSRSQEARLCREATTDPLHAARRLRQARVLREAIFGVAAAITENRDPSERDVRALEDPIRKAVAHSHLARQNRDFRWEPAPQGDPMDQVLWRVALSAQDLLTSDQARRIGQCAGRDCRWLWIDQTKNRSRRWCDMAVCGNRAKAHRHYERRAAIV